MTEQAWNAWFDAQFEAAANGLPLELSASTLPNPTPPPALVADLHLAARLARLDVSAESKTRASLRTRLAWMAITRASLLARRLSGRPARRTNLWQSGLAAVCWLMICLAIFVGPAMTRLPHILGYGYLPEVGFFPLADARLLKTPVEIRQATRQVSQGISFGQGPDGAGITWLWIEGGPEALNPAEIWLEVPAHPILPLQSIAPGGSRQVRLAFAALPPGTTWVELHGVGEAIHLEWFQAAGAGGVPTQVVEPTSTRAPVERLLKDGAGIGNEKGAALVDLSEIRPVPTPMPGVRASQK